MDASVAVTQLSTALGATLLRSNRAVLYERLTAGDDDVDATLYPVLSGLARLDRATPTQLAEAIGLDRSVTTRYAARLEEVGLVVRLRHEADRRSVELALTPRGRSVIAHSRTELDALIANATRAWEPERIARLANDLDELIRGIQHEGEDGAPAERGGSGAASR